MWKRYINVHMSVLCWFALFVSPCFFLHLSNMYMYMHVYSVYFSIHNWDVYTCITVFLKRQYYNNTVLIQYVQTCFNER